MSDSEGRDEAAPLNNSHHSATTHPPTHPPIVSYLSLTSTHCHTPPHSTHCSLLLVVKLLSSLVHSRALCKRHFSTRLVSFDSAHLLLSSTDFVLSLPLVSHRAFNSTSMTTMASSTYSRSSSWPSLVRLLSISSLTLLATLLPLLTSAQSSSPPFCGGAGLDLTPLSYTSNPSVDLDLKYTDGEYWYGLHPCGIVEETFCPTPAAMMCEYGTTLAYNRVDEIGWTAYTALNGTVTGVTMAVANGESCQLGSGDESTVQPRSIAVHFICDASVKEAKIITVKRPTSCSTEAVVHTRYACAGSGVVSDSDSGLSASQKQTIAIVVSVVSVLLIIALTAVCVVMCRRWRAGQAVWAKTSGNKLLDTTVDDTDKSMELSMSSMSRV